MMKLYWCRFLVLFYVFAQTNVHAMDPDEVDGAVTLMVDRSKPVWTITVTNHSEEGLGYEMMGKVPRGLGLEVWNIDDVDGGLRIHAEDLAGALDLDGFPADIREIKPGKSEVFNLNPKSMSAETNLDLAKWERAKKNRYYDCRVFFGVYGSRTLKVSPKERMNDTEKGAKVPEPKVVEKFNDGEPFGIQLRRRLESKNLALVDYNRGTDHKGEYFVSYTTCSKVDLERVPAWDGSKLIYSELHKFEVRAQTEARKKYQDSVFDGIMISSCNDDPKKRFVTFWYVADRGDVIKHFLLNDAPLKNAKLSLTKKQYVELEKFGITKLVKSESESEPGK